MSAPLHPSVAHVLGFFTYEHLPQPLQDVSRPYCELAQQVAEQSSNPETTVALRKLLESKDAAVRAVVEDRKRAAAAAAAQPG